MADAKTPAISIVLPVYNRETVIAEAVRSVLSQQFEDFELIVVDDGSTDRSAEVIGEFDDPRLRVIRLLANAGGNAARNRGIEAARAPLVAFLDSDDNFLPHKIGFTVRFFAEHPNVDALLDSFIKRYPERERADLPLRNPVLTDNGEILEALFNRRIWKATPGIAVRRDAAIRAGMFDEELKRRQDFDFILRLAKVGRLASSDEIGWIKNFSTDTISGGLGNFASSTVEFYRRHPEYYADPHYRTGFAHDVGRHFARLVKRRAFGPMIRDMRTLAGEIGWLRLLGLTARGVGLFKARRRSIRPELQAGKRRDGKLQEAARNGGSPRSTNGQPG